MLKLTVQRKVNGKTIEPTSGSVSTKLEPPITLLLLFPNEQPLKMPG